MRLFRRNVPVEKPDKEGLVRLWLANMLYYYNIMGQSFQTNYDHNIPLNKASEVEAQFQKDFPKAILLEEALKSVLQSLKDSENNDVDTEKYENNLRILVSKHPELGHALLQNLDIEVYATLFPKQVIEKLLTGIVLHKKRMADPKNPEAYNKSYQASQKMAKYAAKLMNQKGYHLDDFKDFKEKMDRIENTPLRDNFIRLLEGNAVKGYSRD